MKDIRGSKLEKKNTYFNLWVMFNWFTNEIKYGEEYLKITEIFVALLLRIKLSSWEGTKRWSWKHAWNMAEVEMENVELCLKVCRLLLLKALS